MIDRRPRLGRILIETTAYFALASPDDAWHQDAGLIMRRVARDRGQLFTTNLVLAEMHALLLRRMGRATALRVLTEVDRSITTIIRVEPEDETRAREVIRRYDDKDFSFTDATCFSVMERLRLGAAFTFDRNFAQYGLTVLQP